MKGPWVQIVVKCHGCTFHRPESHDDGVEYSCMEPSIGGRAIYGFDTPEWCPLRADAIMRTAVKYTNLESKRMTQ